MTVSGRNPLGSPSVETVGSETAISIREGLQLDLGVSWRAGADG
jgi:hypothetical protein